LQLCNSAAVAMAHRGATTATRALGGFNLTPPHPVARLRHDFHSGQELRCGRYRWSRRSQEVASLSSIVPFAIGEQCVKLGKAVGAEARVG